jgi:hypothetical protein
MKSILADLPKFLPTVTAWAEKIETTILAEGKPLTPSQIADARKAGVAHPEKIRVCLVDDLPEPDNEEILFLAKQIGLYSSHSTSLTLGYGVTLRPDVWESRRALVHEFVHIGQYEKRGNLKTFLGDYLHECIDPGYPFGSLEQQAILISKEICKDSPVAPTAR